MSIILFSKKKSIGCSQDCFYIQKESFQSTVPEILETEEQVKQESSSSATIIHNFSTALNKSDSFGQVYSTQIICGF